MDRLCGATSAGGGVDGLGGSVCAGLIARMYPMVALILLPACWKRHKTGSGDVMGRLRWDQPSVTIRISTEFHKLEKRRYLHPTEHRAGPP